MYTIKHAAEIVGITAATLRAWERRYGIVSPSRSDGGYRLYGEADLRALKTMASLIAQGRTPSVAAKEALRSGVREPARAGSQAAPQHWAEEMVAAAETLDAGRLAAVLDELFAAGSFEAIVDRHLLPAVAAMGDAWASGRLSVAGEHFASHAVMRRLAAAFEAASRPFGVRRVLIGLPPGARHEIGVLAFAVAARRRGVTVDFLGADLPVDDWRRAIGADDVRAVVIAVPTADDVAAARDVVSALSDVPLVAVGGGRQDDLDDVVHLGHDIVDAADLLAHLMSELRV